MKNIKLERYVNFKAKDMMALVAGVRTYQDFLPWVKGVRIWNEGKDQFSAELLIGYKNFRAPFATNVKVDEQNSNITTSLIKEPKKLFSLIPKPMKHLECSWKFIQEGEGCNIILNIDYEFADPILASLINHNLRNATDKLMASFINEASKRFSPVS